MELSPSWEATCCPTIQEFLNILWSTQVHYHVHKSPSLVRHEPDQCSPYHPMLYIRSISISSLHPSLGLPNGVFFLAFPPNSYIHSSSPQDCYIPCPSHPPWLDYSWWWIQIMKLLIMQFSPTSYHFIPLWSKSSSALCCQHAHAGARTHTHTHTHIYIYIYIKGANKYSLQHSVVNRWV
jgi:hypothetical protein